MPDPTTTNLALAQPVHNTDIGTWDQPLNANTGIIDTCVGAGVTTVALSSSNVTLTASQLQVRILRFTGTLTANCQINVSAILKDWVIENNTLQGAGFVVTVTGGAGNVVGLPLGPSQVYWDGSNVSFVNLGRVGEIILVTGQFTPGWMLNSTVQPYLICNGSTFNAGTYPQLNALLGGNTLPNISLASATLSMIRAA